jgi:hypothetical protein
MYRSGQHTNKPFQTVPVTRHFPCEYLPYCSWGDGRKSASDEYYRSDFHLVSILWKSPDVLLFAFSWVPGKSQKNSAAHADDGYRGNIPETAPEPTQCGTPDIPVLTTQCGHCTAGSGLEYRYYLPPTIRLPVQDKEAAAKKMRMIRIEFSYI